MPWEQIMQYAVIIRFYVSNVEKGHVLISTLARPGLVRSGPIIQNDIRAHLIISHFGSD